MIVLVKFIPTRVDLSWWALVLDFKANVLDRHQGHERINQASGFQSGIDATFTNLTVKTNIIIVESQHFNCINALFDSSISNRVLFRVCPPDLSEKDSLSKVRFPSISTVS